MNDSGIVIIGAGLSGLGCGRLLSGAKIYEANAYPGGHARSQPLGGFFFDEGAHICHSRDQDYLDFVFKSAGSVCTIAPSIVRNVHDGRWLTYPIQNNLHELPAEERIAALEGFVTAQIDRANIQPANYREWCLNQYGEFLTKEFYQRYTRKYWRVSMEELATDWLSGRLLPAQIKSVISGAVSGQGGSNPAVFSKFYYPQNNGYFGFFAGLYDGLSIAYQHRVCEIDVSRRRIHFENGKMAAYEALASSIPLPVLISCIPDAPAEVKAAAAKLCHTKLLCVNLVVNRPKLSDAHWFYLYDDDVPASRVSIVSNLGAEKASRESTAIQAEIFRRNDEELPVEALAKETIRSLTKLLGFSPSEITHRSQVVVPYAYVVSDSSRQAAADLLTAWLRAKKIFPMGLFGKWKYVWSDVALRDGELTAREIGRLLQ